MAVYTRLTHDDISGFLAHYGVGYLSSATGITEGIENTNYLVEADDGRRQKRYILTVFEQRVNAADLPFFLGLTEWLCDRGIPCPRPQKGYDGRTVYTLKHKPAALISFLSGGNNPEITPQHLTLVGELAARMHLAAEGFPMTRRNGMAIEAWHDLFIRFRNQADEITRGLEKLIEEELRYLDAHWPPALPGGVVHADLFPDNIFFAENRDRELVLSGVIDFYFACNEFWAYDLLVAMNAWCFDAEHRFVKERAQTLLGAYNRLRPMTVMEKQAMPTLARGACMRFLATRAHDWLHRAVGAQVVPKDPMEYVAKLRFHQGVKDCSDYGLPL